MNSKILSPADADLHAVDVETRRKQQVPLRSALHVEAQKLAMFDELVDALDKAEYRSLGHATNFCPVCQLIFRARELQK